MAKCAYCDRKSVIICCECGNYACVRHTYTVGLTSLVCYKCARRLMREMTEEEVFQIKRRIFSQATEEQRKILEVHDAHGSPASFWGAALSFGLCSQEEFEKAKKYYEKTWHYRGD